MMIPNPVNRAFEPGELQFVERLPWIAPEMRAGSQPVSVSLSQLVFWGSRHNVRSNSSNISSFLNAF